MGFQEASKEGSKWIIAGVPLRAPLKPIYTKQEDDGDDDREWSSTTPTGEESRIPVSLTRPPPPPRKRKASLKCNVFGGGGREFFNPPDLESVFIRQFEKAN